jgi:pimeloyl-ACP methyl ester carboxylesterase
MLTALIVAIGGFLGADMPTIPKFVPRVSIGGWGYWSDVAVADGCRIQRHAVYDGYRLLDEQNRAVAAGSLADCRKEWSRRLSTGAAKLADGEVVVLLHGVFRTRRSMRVLESRLQAHGFHVVSVDYASTCLPMEQHAKNLASVISNLSQAKRIHLVGHSMGGLVIRRYLAGAADSRIKRVVMLGTPNHGSEVADWASELGLYHLLFGPVSRELCTANARAGLEECSLPVNVEAAVIAGGFGRRTGLNPLLRGDNDGLVTVESAKLPGACDFLCVPVYHGGIVRSAAVADAVARFLQTGALGAKAG